MQLHHRLVSILRRVRQDVAILLDKEAINAACREENYSWKNRLFNPANTVHLFITQILGSSGDTIPNSEKINYHRQSRWYEEGPLKGPLLEVTSSGPRPPGDYLADRGAD